MTREEVLDVLDALSPLKRKKLQRAEVPVHFLKNNRIAVSLPGERYAPDEQIRLGGKFQSFMTLKKGSHGFIDFSTASDWNGLKTALEGGFH
jgi:hypothetical protein